jgi:hypothetical protein
MTIDRLKPQIVRTLKSDILCRLDTSGKNDREKLEAIEDIRGILRRRVLKKRWLKRLIKF